MPTPEKAEQQQAELRKRRREWALILLCLLLVFALTQYESRLLDLSSGVSLANGILVLALININLLLILLFFFLVFRNLFKLILERRRGVPGARIRSKLVIAFVALSLVPTMLLFFVSAGFITNTIENWFNTQVENSLQESLEVAETYYKNSASNALYYGEQLARIIKRDRLLNQANLDRLEAFIQEKQKEYNLGIVEVFSSTYEELVRVTNPDVPAAEFTDPGSDAIREALQGNRFTRITPIGKADLIRGIVPVYSNWNPDDVVGVVVVNYYVPHSLVAKMKEIKTSFEQYKGTKMVKGRIQVGYVVVLLLIALVIIFLATWFGFHLARGITVPIQELAMATNRVRQGDLDVKIDINSDDEIGTLVEAFNTMTADLRKGQKSLQAANRELQVSNLELDQRRRYMEIVLRNITGGVIAIDKSGNLTTVNKAAEKLLNIRNKKILGKNFREVLDPEYIPLVREILRELLESGKDSISKQITIPVQENKLTLLVHVTTLRDENGEFMGTVVVFDDLTQLIKAQRMAAWREVARRIAHEIKNPLTPIQLSAQRLRRRYLDKFGEDDKVFDECTAMIVQQVEELKNLVNEFSNFARMPASRPTPNDLNQIVAETLILFQEGHKNINFSFRPDPDLPAFNLDRDQIKRTIINLVDNAIGAIADEGSVSISTHFSTELQMATLTVADTGCGIPPQIKPRLFEPYFSTKKSGTGLGLAIVSSIISDHNGYIRVRDNLPRGTQFIVELPVGESTALSSKSYSA
ncbi:sensor histidine kinase [Geoalkalibacter halelectricus]|uniref:histidine kinase n=1 Tax=Geoalkalibacter halelectricus TaxID=2847045 RepID=A0ABY5ZTG6_9BACT|nr:ATP-binding protein [Geoalkalibacter halelectricus]MDO3379201.1 ATP-binding protein [Geoalkalibacter halelectricus]UWZ80959.1 ATP-binding protein [Geoalkalibacter halelectricus]